jgi:hypothetical protein
LLAAMMLLVRSFSTTSRPGPAGGRQDHQRRSDADLKTQVHIAGRRPAPNTPILQGDVMQDDEHIGWRDPEAAQVPNDRLVQVTLGIK